MLSTTICHGILFSIIEFQFNFHNGLNLVWSITITKPVYMGNQYANDFVLFSERKTWLEARDVCVSMGNILQFNNWNTLHWYIKTKALRNGWPITDDVWVGIIKHENSKKWHEVRRTDCTEKSKEIPGLNQIERQCAALNMSAAFDGDEPMIYFSSCDGQNLGFICQIRYGKLPIGIQTYSMSKVVEEGSERNSLDTLSEIECAINSFSKFHCYAATFFPEEENCVAECAEMTNIPETVSLVNSTSNSTVLLRSYNKVFINHTVSALPPSNGPYPCLCGTSTSTNVSVTSSQELNATSTFAQSLDETTTSSQLIDGLTTIYQTSEDTTVTTVNGSRRTVTQLKADVTTFQDDVTITQKADHTTTQAQSGCFCICTKYHFDITQEILNQKVTDIKKNLIVNKTLLSSTQRKKTSASDDRHSCIAMGTVGVCVIIGVIMTFVVCDLVHLVSCVRIIRLCFVH